MNSKAWQSTHGRPGNSRNEFRNKGMGLDQRREIPSYYRASITDTYKCKLWRGGVACRDLWGECITDTINVNAIQWPLNDCESRFFFTFSLTQQNTHSWFFMDFFCICAWLKSIKLESNLTLIWCLLVAADVNYKVYWVEVENQWSDPESSFTKRNHKPY